MFLFLNKWDNQSDRKNHPLYRQTMSDHCFHHQKIHLLYLYYHSPTGNTVSKAVTNFTEAPETAAEAQAQAEAQAEEDGFTIYTQESNYDV